MSVKPPPIEVSRKGIARYIPPTREEFTAAVQWAGDQARRVFWPELTDLERFVANMVVRQLRTNCGAMTVGWVRETGKPFVCITLRNGMTDYLEITSDTALAAAMPEGQPASPFKAGARAGRGL